ncbi:hypothetical protein IAT38_007528 [Cryptococcus sp. DSM 104549]
MSDSGSDIRSDRYSYSSRRKVPRRLLNEEEVDIVTDLTDILQELDQNESFACSGTIAAEEWNKDACLIYFKGTGSDGKQKEGGEYKSIPLPLSEDAARDIYFAGKPSPFGHGNETVYDETYRQAHEIKPPFFSLTSDVLARTSLLSLLTSKLGYGCPLVARLSKLNAYGEGGFFKPHRDTPRGKNHIGTLVFCLPSAFTGGELVIHHSGIAITFDWAERSKDALSWGFLYSDCEHEVLPVKSGMRVTIAYDIFTSEADTLKGDLNHIVDTLKGDPDPIVDTRLEVLIDAFEQLMNPSFLPEGGDLAIGLVHSYATVGKNVGDELAANLKSGDALTLAAIRHLGLKWSFMAAYNVDDDRCDDEAFKEEMERDPTLEASTLMSKNFYALDGTSWWDGFFGAKGLHTSGKFIWVTKPTHFDVKNTYQYMGNDAGNPEDAYAAAVLVVTLPPADQRASKVGNAADTNSRDQEK